MRKGIYEYNKSRIYCWIEFEIKFDDEGKNSISMKDGDPYILHDGGRLQDRRRSSDLQRFRAHGTCLLHDTAIIVHALAAVCAGLPSKSLRVGRIDGLLLVH